MRRACRAREGDGVDGAGEIHWRWSQRDHGEVGDVHQFLDVVDHRGSTVEDGDVEAGQVQPLGNLAGRVDTVEKDGVCLILAHPPPRGKALLWVEVAKGDKFIVFGSSHGERCGDRRLSDAALQVGHGNGQHATLLC